MNDNAIHLKNLEFSWSDSSAPLLQIPELSVPVGQRLFLLGASGSGKSTLLNILAGLLLPQQGEVQVLGQNLRAMGGRARDAFRAKHLGFIFQQFNLIPYLDVLDNIKLAAHCAGSGTKDLDSRASMLLESLRINRDLWSQRADQLSVGQQQRVAVARAMINKPGIIIADEPTSALDDAVRDDFLQLLLGAHQRKDVTILFVSHDRSLAGRFDRVVQLADINHADKGGERHVA